MPSHGTTVYKSLRLIDRPEVSCLRVLFKSVAIARVWFEFIMPAEGAVRFGLVPKDAATLGTTDGATSQANLRTVVGDRQSPALRSIEFPLAGFILDLNDLKERQLIPEFRIWRIQDGDLDDEELFAGNLYFTIKVEGTGTGYLLTGAN